MKYGISVGEVEDGSTSYYIYLNPSENGFISDEHTDALSLMESKADSIVETVSGDTGSYGGAESMSIVASDNELFVEEFIEKMSKAGHILNYIEDDEADVSLGKNLDFYFDLSKQHYVENSKEIFFNSLEGGEGGDDILLLKEKFVEDFIVKDNIEALNNCEELKDYIIQDNIKEGDLHTNESLRNLIKSYTKDPNNQDLISAIENADTSNITDMSHLFNYEHYKLSKSSDRTKALIDFDLSISKWNVSNVTDMRHMFDGCELFVGNDLSDWDISNVTNTSFMFNNCKSFNCDLSYWNISNIGNMESMFGGAESFNQFLLWDVSLLKNAQSQFGIFSNTALDKDLRYYKLLRPDVSSMAAGVISCYDLIDDCKIRELSNTDIDDIFKAVDDEFNSKKNSSSKKKNYELLVNYKQLKSKLENLNVVKKIRAKSLKTTKSIKTEIKTITKSAAKSTVDLAKMGLSDADIENARKSTQEDSVNTFDIGKLAKIVGVANPIVKDADEYMSKLQDKLINQDLPNNTGKSDKFRIVSEYYESIKFIKEFVEYSKNQELSK